MSPDHRYEFVSPSKRRRILGDIGNARRTPSLEFDMANIDHSRQNNGGLTPRRASSGLEIPTLKKTAPSSDFSSRNKENSRIPTKVDNYIAMNRSLTEKSKLHLPKFEVSYERDRLQEAAHADREIELLKDQLRSLDRKLHLAAQELHGLLDVNETSQTLHRQLLKRKSEMKDRNLQAQKLFDSLEGKVNDSVAHSEKMMHLELRELELKLEDDYNEAKFQLEQQVRASVVFQDTELEDEQKRLKEQKSELEKKLEAVKLEKEQEAKLEKSAMEKELQETLQKQQVEVEKSSEKYREINLKYETVMKTFEDAEKQVREKNAEINDLESQVLEFHDKMEKFGELKSELQNQLNELNSELNLLYGTDDDWKAREHAEKQIFEKSRQQLEKYTATRRNLQHAIFSYSNKARIYLRARDLHAENNQVCIGGSNFAFDHVCDFGNDHLYCLEWRLLANEVLTTHNVTLVFSGSVPRETTYNLCNAFTFVSENERNLAEKGVSVTYTLQSLIMDENSTVDMLNKSSETEINVLANHADVISQRMRFAAVSELKSAVKNSECSGKSVCHILTAETTHKGKTKPHKLFLINLTNLLIEKQAALFSLSNSKLSRLLSHLSSHTRVFHSCDIDTETAKPLLAAISNFHK